MSARSFAGSWLLGLGAGLMALAVVRGHFGSLAFPFLIGAAGFLLLARSGQASRRFPGTDLERGLDRLFALLLPAHAATSAATARNALAQQRRLAGLRRGARRWAGQLQLITIDAYETASRISAARRPSRERDDRALVAKAVEALRAERSRAGTDLMFVNDPVSMLAYGLGARPAAADLTSLDDLLLDLGLSDDGDELRMHFDDVLAESMGADLHLRNDSERKLFRDLAGASFVLGASARILELAPLPPLTDTPTAAAAAI
jgi:hypothetical protein